MASGPSRSGQGGLARFSSRRLVVPRMKAETRDEALQELIATLALGGWVTEPDGILKAAMEREDLISTTVEYGLAFPHVRGVEGGGLVIALGLKKKGLRFGAVRGHQSRIIFLSVIPQAASSFYLRIMAGLVRTFREEDARKQLLSSEDADQVWEILLALTRETIP